ncbi:MAG: sigma-70 family RNA polymerase sigma factor, partial [Planctomycetota bacterium]
MDAESRSSQLKDLLEHAAWVRGLALDIVRDAASAEDLAQAAWVEVLRRPPNTDRPVRPWLRSVLWNLARQGWRSEARRRKRERVVASDRDSLPSPMELASQLETQRKLEEMVAALSEPFRSTILLRYYRGLSAAEIARRQQVPAGTVRWRLKRALDELRERLDEEHSGDRKAWMSGLLPLVGARRGPTSALPVPLTVLLGALTVNKIIAAAAVLLAGVAGLWLLGLLPPGAPVADSPPRPSGNLASPPISTSVKPRAIADSDGALTIAGVERNAPPEATVRTTVEARFIDEQGVPVSGVEICTSPPDEPLAALSGTDGRVELLVRFGAPESVMTLLAAAWGYATRKIEVQVREGAVTRLGDLVLDPGGAVSGQVRDSMGLPIAGAEVVVAEPGSPAGFELDDQVLGPPRNLFPSAVTDAHGDFRVDGVPVGSRRVWAGSDATRWNRSPPLSVHAGQETTGIEVVLESLAPTDQVAGMVISPDGRPVPSARLGYRYEVKGGGAVSGTLISRKDGRFRLRLVDA